MINHASLIARVTKAINKIESAVTAAKVYIVTVDDNIDELNGLVVILAPKSKLKQTKPETTSKQPTQAESQAAG